MVNDEIVYEYQQWRIVRDNKPFEYSLYFAGDWCQSSADVEVLKATIINVQAQERRGLLTKRPNHRLWFNDMDFEFVDYKTKKTYRVKGAYMRHVGAVLGQEVSADYDHCEEVETEE